ncbi:endonuclease [Sphingobium sp. HBC34]|uniref:Endonuclease n=1 Tax=Sphingobium cyanobacteriorum TaxID=3063954 RepID=A0ABT8ZM13_9SPHN|nr:endonuclease/exonuclease/phosphatase family protein [Sphingobium sp. HBC34]MDO7835573.1 endonuclease [Sphingobium sp. HBC34]
MMNRRLRVLMVAVMAAFATSGAGRQDNQVQLHDGAMSPALAGSHGLTVMTYNIKGLPWPIAFDRGAAVERIGDRLARMRRAGQHPRLVLLQEAFSADAMTLAQRAGYRHVAMGPDADLRTPVTPNAADTAFLRTARWDRGEQMGKSMGSGLMILSDYPIRRTDRLAFPDFACAGFDCLANKGVLIAHIDIPGMGPTSIVNAHLNARTASGVPVIRSQQAYRRQIELMAGSIRRHVQPHEALVLGGDMNLGRDRQRGRAFFGTFAQAGLAFVTPGLGGAQQVLARRVGATGSWHDLTHAVRHGKDWLFARNAGGAPMTVLRAQVPFGTEADGAPLSDHFGYMVHYAAQPGPKPIAFASSNPMPKLAGR